MSKIIEFDNPRYTLKAREGMINIGLKHKAVNMPLTITEAERLSAQIDEAIMIMASGSEVKRHG